MSYEYIVKIPAGTRAKFRALVKELGGTVSYVPNETTQAAMKEAEAGVGLETLDVDNLLEYAASL